MRLFHPRDVLFVDKTLFDENTDITYPAFATRLSAGNPSLQLIPLPGDTHSPNTGIFILNRLRDSRKFPQIWKNGRIRYWLVVIRQHRRLCPGFPAEKVWSAPLSGLTDAIYPVLEQRLYSNHGKTASDYPCNP